MKNLTDRVVACGTVVGFLAGARACMEIAVAESGVPGLVACIGVAGCVITAYEVMTRIVLKAGGPV